MALNINGTTGISGVDGSVSAPAVTGTDSNTGITFPSADTIKLSTGGVERMSITNSGVSSPGHILQLVSTYNTTHISTTSQSYVDSGISATITPSSTSNKIFIQSTFNVGASEVQTVYFKLYNGSSEITAATNGNSGNGSAFTAGINHASGAQFDIGQIGHNFLYTSNTTSATTIKVYWRCDGGTAYINRYGYSTSVGGGSCLTLLEVAG